MAYLVKLADRAERDLADLFHAIESRSLRHLLYGKKPHVYRVIFRILEDQKQVEVLHIRHGARRRFDTADIA